MVWFIFILLPQRKVVAIDPSASVIGAPVGGAAVDATAAGAGAGTSASGTTRSHMLSHV